jgi:hypothetical protein
MTVPAEPQPEPTRVESPPLVLRTNPLAILSLVFSLLSYCALPVVGAIAGVVCGYLARREIEQTGEQGAGAATAGIILGWIHLGLVVLLGLAAVALAVAGVWFAWRVGPDVFPSDAPAVPSPLFPT